MFDTFGAQRLNESSINGVFVHIWGCEIHGFNHKIDLDCLEMLLSDSKGFSSSFRG